MFYKEQIKRKNQYMKIWAKKPVLDLSGNCGKKSKSWLIGYFLIDLKADKFR